MKKDIVSLSIIGVIILLFCLPFLVNIRNIYFEQQWLDNCSFQAFARKSILEFKQFPLWSPYFGGGYPFEGHPESLSLSPFIIPILIFGEWIGYKIFFLIGYLLGGVGMFYLARKGFNYNLPGAIFSALLFTLTSFFPYHLHSGNFYIANFFYFPILLLFFIKAKDDNRALFLSSMILAFLIFNGMALYWLTAVLFLALSVILKSVTIKQKNISFEPGYLKRWMIMMILALLIASVKIFPLAEVITKNPRAIEDYNIAAAFSVNFNNLYLSLFSKGPFMKPMDWFPDGNYADSVMYMGFIPVVLCLVSFWVYRKQKDIKVFFILLIVFAMLSLGKNSPVDIFRALWRLPLFHSMHDPNRYFSFYIMFILALIAGKVFNYLRERNRLINAAVIILAILSINDMFWANRKYQENLFKSPLPSLTAEKTFYQIKNYDSYNYPKGMISLNKDHYQYFWLLRGLGKIDWVCDLNLGEYATSKFYISEVSDEKKVNPDYKGEVYFLGKDNKAELISFSPNKIIIDVDIKQPDNLIINQNYSNYWKSDHSLVKDFHGLISIPLEKSGSHRISLFYHPLSFYAGLAVSLVSLAIALAALKKEKNKCGTL